jgi:hypothetical protein
VQVREAVSPWKIRYRYMRRIFVLTEKLSFSLECSKAFFTHPSMAKNPARPIRRITVSHHREGLLREPLGASSSFDEVIGFRSSARLWWHSHSRPLSTRPIQGGAGRVPPHKPIGTHRRGLRGRLRNVRPCTRGTGTIRHRLRSEEAMACGQTRRLLRSGDVPPLHPNRFGR